MCADFGITFTILLSRRDSVRCAHSMRVLAIDPSLRGTGFAVLETAAAAANGRSSALAAMPLKARACEYGTIKNRADLLPSSCLVAIHDDWRRSSTNTSRIAAPSRG